MKFNLKLAVAAMLLLCISMHAQVAPIKIQKGAITKDKKKHSELLYSIDDGNGGVVLVREYLGGVFKFPKGYYIEYYNSSLGLVQQKDIKIDGSGIKNILVKDGKIHILEYRENKDNGTNDYNVLTANLNDFKFSSKTFFL